MPCVEDRLMTTFRFPHSIPFVSFYDQRISSSTPCCLHQLNMVDTRIHLLGSLHKCAQVPSEIDSRQLKMDADFSYSVEYHHVIHVETRKDDLDDCCKLLKVT